MPDTLPSVPAPGAPPPAATRRPFAAWLPQPARGWPIAVLALGAALGVAATLATTRSIEAERQSDFERDVDRVANQTQRRLNASLHGLNGLRALHAALPELGREQVRSYVEARPMADEFPGTSGFGFAQRVAAGDLARFVAKVRTADAPDFELRDPAPVLAERPAEPAPPAMIVKHIEPLWPNIGLRGRDLDRVPALRVALGRALASGQATLSERVDLALADGRRANFVHFVPLYRHGTDSVTPTQRLNAAVGVLLAPVVEQEVLAGVADVVEGRVRVDFVDPTASRLAAPEPLAGAELQALRSFEIGGRVLALRAHSTPSFDLARDSALPSLVATASLLLTLLAAWATWLLAAGRERALRLAQAMTADLDRLAKVAQLTSNAVFVTDPAGRAVWVNDAFSRFTGLAPQQALGRDPAALLQLEHNEAADVAPIRAALAAGQACRGRLRNRSTQGREYWIEFDLQPLRAADGSAAGFIAVESDVTALRETATDLARERTRLTAILEGTNAGAGEWDLASGRIQFSEQFATMLGYAPDEFEPMDSAAWNRLCHPDDLPAAHAALVRHLKGETPFYAHELRMRHRSGDWRWVQTRSRVSQRAPDGRALRMAGSHIDTTAHKLAEQRWQARAEMSGDWFWQTDSGHRLIELTMSEESRAVTGDAILVGLRRDEVEWLDPPEGGWAAFHALFDSQLPFKGLCYHSRRVPEDPRWIEIDGRPRLDAGGRFLGYAGVGRDITERRRVTEHLRESLAQMDALLEAIPIAVVMKDLEGRLVRVNRAYCGLVGQSAEALLGKTRFDILRADTAHDLEREDQALLAEGTVRRREVELRFADGRVLEAYVIKAPIVGADGVALGIVSAAIDITQQKATERALLEAKDAAEAANRAKSAFLAAMSHEIRTPMNGVLGLSELLALSRLDDEQARTVDSMRGSALSLLRILDDVLDFSKIEAGRLELELAPFELSAVVDGVCDALAPMAAERGVALAASVHPALAERVLGDSTRLRQVLNNLVGNAIKFSAGLDGRLGRVSLRVEQAGAADPRLRFVVTDNGIGIDEPALARLFTPFTQAETSTTRRFGGTGLGLAISRRLVELMGGCIEAASQPGVGSTFSVLLELPPTEEQPPRRWPDLAGVTCLLVDQADLPVGDLCAWLQAAGARAQVLADTGAVCAAAAAAPEGIVIVDDRLPLPEVDCDLRQLRIGRGRRGPARVLSPSVAALDLLRRESFLRAVAMLAGRASPEPGPGARHAFAADERVAPPTRAQALARGQLILVAEDDETNREVIVRQLAMLGHTADLAEDGAQALQMWRDGDYALLLTDLHMPRLDGYTLAATLRRDEQAGGRERMPVLALTANALKGEAVRAREAGMDDYLTKPVPLQLLNSALRLWMPAPRPLPAAALPYDPGALDLDVLRRLVGDDESTLRDLLTTYLGAARVQAAEVRQALASGDARQAGALAHKLKSASNSVGAQRLGRLCADLERPGRRPEPADVERFGQAFGAVERAIMAALDQERIA